MLKIADAELELFSVVDMYMFVEKEMRQGALHISNTCSWVNNMWMGDCNENKKLTDVFQQK